LIYFFAERHVYDSDLIFQTNIVLNPCGTVDTDGDSVGDLCDACPNDPILSLPPPSGWSCHTLVTNGDYGSATAIARLSSTATIHFVAGSGTGYFYYRTFLGFPTATPLIYWTSGVTTDVLSLSYRPAAVTTSSNTVLVAGVSGHNVYTKIFTVTTTASSITVNSFTLWKPLTGAATYFAVAVTSYQTNVIELFAIGSGNNGVYRSISTDNGNTFTLPVLLSSEPAITSIVGTSLAVPASIFSRKLMGFLI